MPQYELTAKSRYDGEFPTDEMQDEMQEFSARLEARGITTGIWDYYYDDGKGERSLELGVTLLASTSEEARERVTEALTTETPPGWSVDWSVRLGVSTRARALAERVTDSGRISRLH